MIAKEEVVSLVEEFLKDSDIFLVDVVVRPGNCIVIEIDNVDGISIENCAGINRYVEDHLDREKEDYELEVGSAGLTSPFKVLKQYQKNIGSEIEVLSKDGRKLYGLLTSVNEDSFVLTIKKMVKPEGSKRKVEVAEELAFQYEEVKHAKYLLKV